MSSTKSSKVLQKLYRDEHLTNIDLDKRAVRDLKRKGTTEIPREEFEKIMAKYNQPPEMVDAFLDVQKAGKKKVDNLIKKINARIEANPEAIGGRTFFKALNK